MENTSPSAGSDRVAVFRIEAGLPKSQAPVSTPVPEVRAKWRVNRVMMMKIFSVLLVAGLVSLSVYYLIKLNHKVQDLEELRNAVYILSSNYSALLEAQANLQSQYERKINQLQKSQDKLKSESDTNYSNLQKSHDSLGSQYVTLNEKLDEVTKEFSVLKEIYCDGTNTSPDNTCSLCKPGWFLFSSKCYFISTNELTWKASHDWCETRRGRLVNIETLEEQDFLKSKARSYYWIGRYNISKENKSTRMGAEPVKSKRASDDDKEECLLINMLQIKVYNYSCGDPNHWICESAVFPLRI